MIYLLPEGYRLQDMQQDLSMRFGFISESAAEISYRLYDSFDWRLYEKGLCISLVGSEMKLVSLQSGESLEDLAVNNIPNFVWNLQDGEMRSILEPILEMRALLDLGEFQKTAVLHRILNQDEKTVCRVVYHDIQGMGVRADRTAFVEIKGVRGYQRHMLDVSKACQENGFVSSSWKDIYHRIIAASGRSPGDYSTKLDFQLLPEMRADKAIVIILKFLVEIMRSNEAGIQDDLDTEFLHDFRVAVRRTRSAMNEIKGVFPASVLHRYKNDFSRIGAFTNHLRDLDVYLLNEAAYRAMLPGKIQDDIGPLFTYLQGLREAALQEVIDELNSSTYSETLGAWEAFLDSPLPLAPEAPNAARPIVDLASKSIYKRYRSIVKNGIEILDAVEEQRLHGLRIDCKKLRTLMEIFASLYPEKEIGKLIKQVKLLQDNLGSINDLSVQEEYLLQISMEMPVHDAASRQALVAIGSLVEALDEQKKLIMGDFSKTFRKFASSPNRALFQGLFKDHRTEDSGGAS